MKTPNKTGLIRLLLALAATLAAHGLSGSTGSLIDFTIAINSGHDGGLSYTNYTAGQNPDTDRYVIGFELTISAIDGEPVSIGPLATFCSEIEEPISAGTQYSFNAAPLSSLAAGTAGQSGTGSVGIPAGGIGSFRAARLAYLFDQHYISSALTDWTMTDANPTLHAFQLAVWEITHDTDLNLSDTNGIHYLSTQTGGSNPTRRQNAVTLAQSWLDDVAVNVFDSTYVSQNFDILSLVSSTGNPEADKDGFQDIVLAFDKSSPEATTFEELATVPEPAHYVLLLGLLAGTLPVASRRFRE
jgi:hypothetical protein